MNWAHVHLLLNHIPVLGGIASMGLVLLAVRKNDKSITLLCFRFMILVGVLSLPVYFTGEPAEKVIEHLPGFSESLVENHEDLALYSLFTTEFLALIGIYGLFKFKKNSQVTRNFWMITILVALVNMGLMLVTANYGGKIRHTEIRSDAEKL